MAARKFDSKALAKGVFSILVFLVLWEIGSRSKTWITADAFSGFREMLGAMGFSKKYLPWIGAIPAPERGNGEAVTLYVRALWMNRKSSLRGVLSLIRCFFKDVYPLEMLAYPFQRVWARLTYARRSTT